MAVGFGEGGEGRVLGGAFGFGLAGGAGPGPGRGGRCGLAGAAGGGTRVRGAVVVLGRAVLETPSLVRVVRRWWWWRWRWKRSCVRARARVAVVVEIVRAVVVMVLLQSLPGWPLPVPVWWCYLQNSVPAATAAVVVVGGRSRRDELDRGRSGGEREYCNADILTGDSTVVFELRRPPID